MGLTVLFTVATYQTFGLLCVLQVCECVADIKASGQTLPAAFSPFPPHQPPNYIMRTRTHTCYTLEVEGLGIDEKNVAERTSETDC